MRLWIWPVAHVHAKQDNSSKSLPRTPGGGASRVIISRTCTVVTLPLQLASWHEAMNKWREVGPSV